MDALRSATEDHLDRVISLSGGALEHTPDVIAFGAFLKNTVTVIHDGRAWISRVAGDLGTPEAIADFEAAARALPELSGATPILAAHDLHPDFYSTTYAEQLGAENSGVETLGVQHHHAHIAAVTAEHGLSGPVIGLALDGFGLGPDNEAWGGELLYVDGAEYRRLGHLDRLAQPGGDVAAREPWRMGAAVLHKLGRSAEIATRFAEQGPAALLAQVLTKGINCPETSSAGRLFDAACGLAGVLPVATFEGEAPMAFERLVTRPCVLDGGWTVSDDGRLDLLVLLEALIDSPPEEAADLFHGTLAAALADWANRAAEQTGATTVAMGGGCFFNAVLKAELCPRLEALGLTPLLPINLSPGDPVISFGQACIAALHAAGREQH
ncbi:MAG: hydrogenase maturation protein HypF [Magnetovibrionaceae bacterium]